MNIFELLDRPIAYHKVFADLAGSVTGGVFLSQAVYWSRRTSDPAGFFYKSRDQWTAETGLTRSEQETARKNLRLSGILIEQRGGEDNRLFYKIDTDRLVELLSGRQDSTNRSAESCQPEGRILPTGRQDPADPHYRDYNKMTTHNSFARAPRRAEKKGVVTISNLSDFLEEYLDDSLTAWATEHAPDISLEAATRAWIEYHTDHSTEHKSRVAVLRSWRGWIRNAQNIHEKTTASAGKGTHARKERTADLDSLRAVGLIH